MLYGIVAATASLLLATLLTALLRTPALRLGVVDRRRTRQRPVPLLGGLAVVLVTGLVVGVVHGTGVVPLGSGVAELAVAGGAVGALGLAADLWRVRRRWLVAGTAVAAVCVVPYEETGVVTGVLAAGWIAGVAVAFRGLDHADGLAGTVGVVTAFGAGACAAAEVMDGLAVLLSVLAAALTGFLLHNWHPARIGLGACGSLFTGFVLAAAAVFTRAGRDPGAGAGVLFALTALAVADVALVVLSRRSAGRPLLRSGVDHLAHRLRGLGFTARGAVVLLGTGTFAGVLVGVLVHTGWAGASAVLWVAGGSAVTVLVLLRTRAGETEPRGRLGPGTGGRRCAEPGGPGGAEPGGRRGAEPGEPGGPGGAEPGGRRGAEPGEPGGPGGAEPGGRRGVEPGGRLAGESRRRLEAGPSAARRPPERTPRHPPTAANFPVRQARGSVNSQVRAPLRVRNG
ncbi:MraY family glycosyltransferase [Streptomyces sp. HMX87]|uniref:MraY family glycosyltransferase n=1 Tax=Streptomyces sp. HMX87 TaxID=3390849 RepID=UPI003A835B03